MASITIMHSTKNLIFAAEVANQTGAEFEEEGQWIKIYNSPTLEIPEYCFREAFDPRGTRGDTSQLESVWRSLLLNKVGYLVYFGDDEIVLSDTNPKEKPKRPQFLLRFNAEDTKDNAELWAERAGYDSLTSYINAAVEAFNEKWKTQSK
jgi:hypothetical protein